MRNSGQQWDRVMRTPQDPKESARQEANAKILMSDIFLGACIKAGIGSTTRQASKYRRKRGKAFMSKS